MLTSSTAILSQKIFNINQQIWFISLFIAQVFFVIYLTAGYGMTIFTEDWSKLNRFNGSAYISGDTLGNVMYAAHVLLAIIMISGGSLQLIPSIRNRFNTFHRYNGRLFVLLACTISLAGIFLITVRGTVGNPLLHCLTAFSGVVVIVSSFFAIKAARTKHINVHKQWTLRLFLAANGVLFFRLFLFAWIILFGTRGINTDDFTGPTIVSISVLSYVIPLIVVQFVWYANKSKQTWLLNCLSCLLLIIAIVFLIGLFGLVAGNWYPALFAR